MKKAFGHISQAASSVRESERRASLEPSPVAEARDAPTARVRAASAAPPRARSFSISRAMSRPTGLSASTGAVVPSSGTGDDVSTVLVTGDSGAVVRFLQLAMGLSSGAALVAALGRLERSFVVAGIAVRVQLITDLGGGQGLCIDDGLLRACRGVVYAHNAVSTAGHADRLRRARARVGAVKGPEARVVVVALANDGDALEQQLWEARLLATQLACQFASVVVGSDSLLARAVEDAATCVGAALQGDGALGKADALAATASRSVDVLVVGDILVGKTALLQQLAFGRGAQQYVHTTEIVHNQAAYRHGDARVRVQFIDTPAVSSEAEFAATLPQALWSKVQGCILVYSVCNLASFRLIPVLLRLVQSASGNARLPVLVVGTHVDEPLWRFVLHEEAVTAFRVRVAAGECWWTKLSRPSRCQSMGLPYAEVNCLDPTLSADALLEPLLARVLASDAPLDAAGPSVSPRPLSPPPLAVSGVLHLLEVTKRKEVVWHAYTAEIRRDTLVFLPCGESPSATQASLQATVSATLRTTLQGTFRRRSLSRSSPAVSPAPSPPAERLSNGSITGMPVDAILLLECTVHAGQDHNSDTGRFPFAIVDVAGVMHSLEAESAAARERWVAALCATRQRLGAPSPMDPVNSRRRVKTVGAAAVPKKLF